MPDLSSSLLNFHSVIHEGEEEDPEYLHKFHVICLWMLTATVATSVVFKSAQERLHKLRGDFPFFGQMVTQFFEEFTVIGFVGIFVVFLQQNYLFSHPLSMFAEYFETEVHEVVEILESIHGALFLVLFNYIGLIGMLACVAQYDIGNWGKEEKEILGNPGQMSAEPSAYRRFRHAFFNPSNHFAGCYKADTLINEQTFAFDQYLAHCTVKMMGRLIELPKYVFVPPLLVAVLSFKVWADLGSESVMALNLAAVVSWGLLFVLLLKTLILRNIYNQLLPAKIGDAPSFYPREDLIDSANFSSSRGADASENAALVGSNEPKGQMLRKTKTMIALKVQGTVAANPQEQLFFLAANGPWVIRSTIQGVLFVMAMLPAVYEKFISNQMKWEHTKHFALYFFPFPVCLILLCRLGPIVVYCTSLEQMADKELVEKVGRKTRNDRFAAYSQTTTVRRLVSQLKYEAMLHKYKVLDQSTLKDAIEEHKRKFKELPPLERAYIHAVFKRFDKDGSGKIQEDELLDCLVSTGYSESSAESIISDWFSIYDTDRSGMLELSEFEMLFHVLNAEINTAEVNYETCMFTCKKLDINKNGKLDKEEFAKAIGDYLGVKMEPADVSGLWANINKEANEKNEIEVPFVARWFWELYRTVEEQKKGEKVLYNKLATSNGAAQ